MRKPSKKKRDIIIPTRISAKERAAWVAAAARVDRSLSSWIRDVANRAAEKTA